MLDALARGVPTLTSSTSSLPEVVGEAAVLADPRSVPAIAGGLRQVLGDTALADRLRREGPARAAAFSWEETARRTLGVYRSIL